jgi:hypothetical protein
MPTGLDRICYIFLEGQLGYRLVAVPYSVHIFSGYHFTTLGAFRRTCGLLKQCILRDAAKTDLFLFPHIKDISDSLAHHSSLQVCSQYLKRKGPHLA